MQNIYDKLLNVKFEKPQNPDSDEATIEENNTRKHEFDEADIEERNAKKHEFMQARKTNNAINNQIDSLDRYNKISDNNFRHNYEKLEKGKKTATGWKKAGITGMIICIAAAAVWSSFLIFPFISSMFGPAGVGVTILALAAPAFYGIYKYASSYKEEAEKKQQIGLAQHGEALRKHTIAAEAGLITSTYTNSEDIPSIQDKVHILEHPTGLEAKNRFYKDKDEENNDEEKDKRNSNFIFNCNGGTQQEGRL